MLGLLIPVLLACLGETAALPWQQEQTNLLATTDKRKGSAGDKPGLSDAPPVWIQFPTSSSLPLLQVSSDQPMKWNDHALKKNVLHRSFLESKGLCQHNRGRYFLWGRKWEEKGACEWAGGEHARSSNTSCGTYHDYNLLCKVLLRNVPVALSWLSFKLSTLAHLWVLCFYSMWWLGFLFLLLFLCSTVISDYLSLLGAASQEKSSAFFQTQHERFWNAGGVGNTLANLFSLTQLLLCMLDVALWTCVPGASYDGGEPGCAFTEGGDDFLRKLLAEKMPSLRYLLLGSQQQTRGGIWLTAEAAGIGRDSWLVVHGQVLCPSSCPPPPHLAAGRLS